MSQSNFHDKVIADFRTAARRALEHGFDAELLAQEIEDIWRKEFEGEDDDE